MDYELEKTNAQNASRLEVTADMKLNLSTAVKWIKFINILGAIGLAICALAGIGTLAYGTMGNSTDSGIQIVTGLIYVVMVAVYVPLLKMAFAFVRQARCACENDDNLQLADMFSTMKRGAKYMGILCIVCLCFYALAFVGFMGAVIFKVAGM